MKFDIGTHDYLAFCRGSSLSTGQKAIYIYG
jgi:hypothetical protein